MAVGLDSWQWRPLESIPLLCYFWWCVYGARLRKKKKTELSDSHGSEHHNGHLRWKNGEALVWKTGAGAPAANESFRIDQLAAEGLHPKNQWIRWLGCHCRRPLESKEWRHPVRLTTHRSNQPRWWILLFLEGEHRMQWHALIVKKSESKSLNDLNVPYKLTSCIKHECNGMGRHQRIRVASGRGRLPRDKSHRRCQTFW